MANPATDDDCNDVNNHVGLNNYLNNALSCQNYFCRHLTWN
jgi:hypothetical protein